MKSIKLLFVSFTITFVALMTLSPANANNVVNVQHLNVNNMLTSKFNNDELIDVAGHLSDSYRNSFSTGQILSTLERLSDSSSQRAIDVVNNSNDFFTSTMVFNDKLQQFISYFTTPINETLIDPSVSTSDSKVIKKKCESSLNFS